MSPNGEAVVSELIEDAEVWGENERDGSPDEWPAPIPLGSPDPPRFPANLLPAALGTFAEALAEHTETPRELSALMCLAVSSAAVAGRCEVEIHPGYTEPLNLFVAAALESGNRKTSVMDAARQPLSEFERDEKARLEPERRRAISERKTLEAGIESLRRKAANGNDSHDETRKRLRDLEESLIEIPDFPRLWTQDITPEALVLLTSKNNERMAILSDEGGYFDILAGRYSRGVPNLDFVLQAHAGTDVRVDRKSGETISLDKPLLTIGLSPQPGALAGLSEIPAFRGADYWRVSYMHCRNRTWATGIFNLVRFRARSGETMRKPSADYWESAFKAIVRGERIQFD